MRTISKYIPFLVANLLLWLAVTAVYPYYQYYVDPDATAYLTVIRRYVAGEYLYAVNGYWSPWACWLVALLVKGGIDIMASAVIVNTAGATCFLLITHSLLRYFKTSERMVWAVNLLLSVFLCYAVFKQLFDDLWGAFFLLSALRIMLTERFSARPILWICMGLLGALSYYAKNYSLPFFILSTICCGYVVTNAQQKENRIQWLKISVVSIIVMFLFSLPWIYLLHWKYGTWMTSTAGPLNLSWYLVGHPYWQPGITTLLPVPYANSPYYWEDPWLVNGMMPHFWNSFALFKLQLVRIPYNLMKMVNSMNELSPLFLLTTFIGLCVVISKKLQQAFPPNMKIAALSMLLFPLAFILMNFEARYIWYMLPVNLVIAAWVIEQALTYLQLKRWLQSLFIILFVFCYLSYPIWDMKLMYRAGQDDHIIAQAIQQAGIHGTFTSNSMPGAETQSIIRIAYFSGNSYFTVPDPTATHADVMTDIQHYGIRYYYYRYHPMSGDYYQLINGNGQPYPIVFNDREHGIKIFRIGM